MTKFYLIIFSSAASIRLHYGSHHVLFVFMLMLVKGAGIQACRSYFGIQNPSHSPGPEMDSNAPNMLIISPLNDFFFNLIIHQNRRDQSAAM